MIESPVVARNARRYDVVAPADFSLGAASPIAALPPLATPYCVDFDDPGLLCVTMPESYDHAFFYQAQRERAASVVRIPYAELPDDDVSPALVFSPGRCGSTLLFRVLSAIGLPSVSEPDYFRQLAFAYNRDKSLPALAYARYLRAATGILARGLGARPVIKLHHMCNFAPLRLSQGFASARIVFILRERRDWALSVKRMSPDVSARAAVQVLKRALAALEILARHHDIRVCHYRDFAQPQAAYFSDLAGYLGHGREVTAEAVRAAASRDSQEGTHAAGLKREAASVDPRYLDEFERQWQLDMPAEIIARRGLENML